MVKGGTRGTVCNPLTNLCSTTERNIYLGVVARSLTAKHMNNNSTLTNLHKPIETNGQGDQDGLVAVDGRIL